MSNDIDFDQLIDLLDRALTSKDPKVMTALKKFLFIAALATEETEEKGPFADLISRIERLEAQVAQQGTYQWPPQTSPSYPGPYWVDNTANPTWYNVQYPNVSVSGTGATTTTYADTSTSFTMSDAASTLVDDTLNDLTNLQEQARDYLQKD